MTMSSYRLLDITSSEDLHSCLKNIAASRRICFPFPKKPFGFHSEAKNCFRKRMKKIFFNCVEDILTIDLVECFFRHKNTLNVINYGTDQKQLTTKDVQILMQLFHSLSDKHLPHNGRFDQKTTNALEKILLEYDDEILHLYTATFDNVEELNRLFSAIAWLIFNIQKNLNYGNSIFNFKLAQVIFSYCTSILFDESIPIKIKSLQHWNYICFQVEKEKKISILTECLVFSVHHFLYKVLQTCFV